MFGILNGDDTEEEVTGTVTKMREDMRHYGEGQAYHYITATLEGGEDIYLPPQVGERVLDRYLDGEDVKVTGHKRDGKKTTVKATFEYGYSTTTVVNEIQEGFGGYMRIYAEPDPELHGNQQG